MRRIEALPLDYPFAGSRRLLGLLRPAGYEVGRLHVATRLKRRGSAALYRRPPPSPPTPGHQIYPSRVKRLAGTRPNQVWALDSPYVPMARGFGDLGAVIAWFSRKGLAGRLSLTLETGPGVEPLRDARAWPGTPEIMNTDQDSPFTAVAFLKVLQDAPLAIRREGKGAGRDNVGGEGLWRTIKDEEVSLRAYRSVSAARRSLDRYRAFYNRCSPHSSLGGQTPDQVSCNQPKPSPAA